MFPEISRHSGVVKMCAFNCHWEITQTNRVAMIQVFFFFCLVLFVCFFLGGRADAEEITEVVALMTKMSLKCANSQM